MIWVVYHRRYIVDGLYERLFFIQLVNSRVVLSTGKDVRIFDRWQDAQNLRKVRRTDFAGSPGSRRI